MELIKLSIICLLFGFYSSSSATELKNGWTNKTANNFIDSCSASAVSKNINYLLNKKVISLGTDKYTSILKKVTSHQNLVCKCTQLEIMKDYGFTEVRKMMSNKGYIIRTAKNCSDQILTNNKKTNDVVK